MAASSTVSGEGAVGGRIRRSLRTSTCANRLLVSRETPSLSSAVAVQSWSSEEAEVEAEPTFEREPCAGAAQSFQSELTLGLGLSKLAWEPGFGCSLS
jgi:hypothetical protein